MPNATIRKKVFERAYFLCEYCLLHHSDLHFPLQIEHIISQKHYTNHKLSNLASACILCNRLKGSDLSTVLPPDFSVVQLYRPRTNIWTNHFEISDGLILPKTKCGEATIRILKLNQENRVLDRLELMGKGWFPHPDVELYFKYQHSY